MNLRRLAALAAMAIEEPDPDALGDRLAGVVEELLPASAASLLLWDAETEMFTVGHSTVPGQDRGYAVRSVRASGGATRAIVDEQRPIATGDIDDDPFGASRMLVEAGLRAYLGVPIVFEGESIGVLYALDLSPREYSASDIDFMTILARRASNAIGLARLVTRLDELARTDELTGLNNRREFFKRGVVEFERESRTHRPLSAAIIDVDDFKAINDGLGHATGDAVLVELARRIRDQLRAFDLVGRIGGEEFAILLPEVDRHLAGRIAERIVGAVRCEPVETARGGVNVTITLGVAERTPDTTDLTGLLDRADEALYHGKSAGRDRVVVFDDMGRHRGSSMGPDTNPDPSGPIGTSAGPASPER